MKKQKNQPIVAVPRDALSAADLVKITKKTERHNRRLASAGWWPPPINGVYQAGPTLLGVIKYLQDVIEKGSSTLKVEQEAFTKAKRELAEEELAQFRGRYVDVSKVSPALRNIALHQRAVLQRKLEQELPAKLAGLTTIEILALMRNAADEICAIFREGTKAWCEAPPAED